MARRTTFDDYNPQKTYHPQELMEMRDTLIRIANRRLSELRKAGINYGAIEIAERTIGKGGKFRKGADDITSLRYDILPLLGFVNSETSTIGGINRQIARRKQTFKDAGFDFADDKDFYNFFQTKTYQDLAKIFSSETLIDIYDMARARKSHTTVQKELRQLYFEYQKKQQPISLKDLQKKLGNPTVKRIHKRK